MNKQEFQAKVQSGIDTDPDNEGQVTYQDKIEKLRDSLIDYEKLIQDFYEK